MMQKVSLGWVQGAGVALAMVVLGCGGSPPPTVSKNPAPVSSQKAAAEVHEKITAHICPARIKLAELLGHSKPPAAPAPAEGEKAESAPPPTSVAAGTKIAANQAYREVAPATVLIRTDRAMGTGVVVDPKGYILTNYHVVADGRKTDFVVSVNVTFGDLTPTGRMTRQEKSYEAVVVKADMVRDMALVKIKDPPPKMTAVKLAKSAPQIAEKVLAVGHAGIGFLWAAKACSISSIGERQQDNSRLAAFDCSNPDPSLSKSDAEKYKKRCDDSKKEMTEALMAGTQGLALQTDCSITHGDSGGPLVNGAGELVGLNQSISADLATVSFHVHLDEIRDFISKHPEEGVAMLPDPYCDGGTNTTLEDVDLDGVPDTLLTKGSFGIFGGSDKMSMLIDLDQTHFAKASGDAVPQSKIALLVAQDTTYVWYDTDDDGTFDLLLTDKGNDGTPEHAYKLDKNGGAKEDKDSLPKHDLSAKFVKDPALHARLAKIATAVGGARYVSTKTLVAGAKIDSYPDPWLGGGTQGRLIDTDGDGKPDVAAVHGTFSSGFLIDADENSLGSLKSGEPADEVVKSKKVDPEVSVIMQGSNLWALYDTDNDAKFDLALLTNNASDPSLMVANQAWKLGPGGEMTPVVDQIGRKMMRPGLLSSFPRLGKSFGVVSMDVASDEGMGSLPDPHLGARARFAALDVKGIAAGTVVHGDLGSLGVLLIDIDHDSKLPFGAKDADVQKAVTDGKFDAEVAMVQRRDSQGGVEWIFYDTDNDGKFDLVLYLPNTGGDAVVAYKPSASDDKKLEADPKLAVGKPLRTSVWKDKAMGPKFKAIAAKALPGWRIED